MTFVEDADVSQEPGELGDSGDDVGPVVRVGLDFRETILDAEFLVDALVEVELDYCSDERPGGRCHDRLLVGVEGRPDFAEVALGKADVAGFLKHVDLGDLARHRVEAFVAHRGPVGMIEQFLDSKDQQIRQDAPIGRVGGGLVPVRWPVGGGPGTTDVLTEHRRMSALIGDLHQQVPVARIGHRDRDKVGQDHLHQRVLEPDASTEHRHRFVTAVGDLLGGAHRMPRRRAIQRQQLRRKMEGRIVDRDAPVDFTERVESRALGRGHQLCGAGGSSRKQSCH